MSAWSIEDTQLAIWWAEDEERERAALTAERGSGGGAGVRSASLPPSLALPPATHGAPHGAPHGAIDNQPPTMERLSLNAPEWETLDPHPDIHALFLQYDALFFHRALASVEVRWSKRMTLCAGLCVYARGSGMCSIRMSQPLLSLRPRSDTVNTLLHEMIHAYLFVTNGNTDRDGHGPAFLAHASRINSQAGTDITVYHSFHDEVDSYRTHVWRCKGVCRTQAPYFGFVKRATNRAPSARDFWWPRHAATCGGEYEKIASPPPRPPAVKSAEPPNSLRRWVTSREGGVPACGTSGGDGGSDDLSTPGTKRRRSVGGSETSGGGGAAGSAASDGATSGSGGSGSRVGISSASSSAAVGVGSTCASGAARGAATSGVVAREATRTATPVSAFASAIDLDEEEEEEEDGRRRPPSYAAHGRITDVVLVDDDVQLVCVMRDSPVVDLCEDESSDAAGLDSEDEALFAAARALDEAQARRDARAPHATTIVLDADE